ncbi:hypothetical protein ACO0LD_16845 [Undibacterium sp. Ji83W]|uniref:hypothetical protein n=1 Tax=Undibacterium sp. Ji83W TaxID=3413043 RepID=UPI003BF4349A
MTTSQAKHASNLPRKIRLAIVFSVHALGWVKLLLLCLLLAVSAAWWYGVPYMQKQIYRMEEQQADLQIKRQQLNVLKQTPVLDDNLQRLNAFYELLGEKKHVEQQVKTILYLANEAGVSLKAGEYQLAENSAGKFFTYKVQLPVKGSYLQIRKFAEQVLLTIPFASLDETSFKRETINGPVIESKMVFTLYVGATATLPGRGFE